MEEVHLSQHPPPICPFLVNCLFPEDLKLEADTSHSPGQSDKGEARIKGDDVRGVRETSTSVVL